MKILLVSGIALVQPESAEESARLKAELTFTNPAKKAAQRFSKNPWAGMNLPDSLLFYDELDGVLSIPRQCFDHGLCDSKTEYEVNERKVEFPECRYTLTPVQQDLVTKGIAQLAQGPCGDALLVAGTGDGKTVIGISTAAALKQKTLVLVHTWAIMKQWISDCERGWGFTPDIIKEDQWGLNTPIVVGMIQTWSRRKELWGAAAKQFGFVINDEVHHLPSASLSTALSACPARYKMGLSATPYRQDGLTSVLKSYLGEPITSPLSGGNSMPLDYVNIVLTPTPTNLVEDEHKNVRFWKIMTSPGRVDRIIDDVLAEWEKGHSCLVVADTLHTTLRAGRKKIPVAGEIPMLYAAFEARGVIPTVLVGATPEKDRERALEALQTRKSRILLSTTSLIQEGANIPCLDRLFVASPTSNQKTLEQLCGRIRRVHPSKRDAKVFYYSTADKADSCRYRLLPIFRDMGAVVNIATTP